MLIVGIELLTIKFLLVGSSITSTVIL